MIFLWKVNRASREAKCDLRSVKHRKSKRYRIVVPHQGDAFSPAVGKLICKKERKNEPLQACWLAPSSDFLT